MGEVKRYDPNYAAMSPADDLAVEAEDGMFVMATDYATLEAENAKLRAILSAPRQPEGEAASILLPALRQYMHDDGSGLLAGYECERTQQIVAELREECERLRVKLMTIASAEPVRHNIEWAKAMAATGNNEAYAKWREAFDQREKLAGLLREARELIDRGDFREGYCMCGSGVDGHGLGDGHAPVDAGEYYAGQVRERIDTALAEVK